MKNNSDNYNLAMLEAFYKDAGYLMRKFSPLLDDAEFRLTEITSNYIKFKRDDGVLIFQYESNRYGTGRELVDITFNSNDNEHRLSQIVKGQDQGHSLQYLISVGSQKYIPPINTFRELYEKYFSNFL